jgi:iduronate 2-sulfatase
LYPTVAALAGLRAPAGIQGKDISSTFNDATAEVRDFAFSVSNNLKEKGQAYLIRTKNWSYIQYGKNAIDGMELYNMDTDPFQYNNIASLPRYQSILKDMKGKLAQKLSAITKNDL